MKPISFILDILPFIGGVKMVIEALFKRELGGERLEGKARKIHLFIGVATFAFDCFTIEGGGITRGLLKLFGEGFLKRLATSGAEVAAEKSVAKKVLQKTASTIGKMEESKLGKQAVKYTEDKIRDEALKKAKEIEDYRKDPEKRREMRERYKDGNNQNQDEAIRKEILRRQKEVKQRQMLLEEAQRVQDEDEYDLSYIRGDQTENKKENMIFNIPRRMNQKQSSRDIIIAQQKAQKNAKPSI